MICEARTDVGRIRTVNEDSILVDNDHGIYLLADGMGGHQAGEVASRLAVEIAHAYLRERLRGSDSSEIARILEEAFQAAHQGVKESACDNPQYKGMGTTLVAVVIDENKAYVCSVGDSRLYLIRGSISQMTVDDTLGNTLYCSKKMTANKIPKNYWKMLTQAIGGEGNIAPSTRMFRFLHDDLLVMCSDGLYEMLSSDEVQIIYNNYNCETNIVADELLKKALNNGGSDNISLILIKKPALSASMIIDSFLDLTPIHSLDG